MVEGRYDVYFNRDTPQSFHVLKGRERRQAAHQQLPHRPLKRKKQKKTTTFLTFLKKTHANMMEGNTTF